MARHGPGEVEENIGGGPMGRYGAGEGGEVVGRGAIARHGAGEMGEVGGSDVGEAPIVERRPGIGACGREAENGVASRDGGCGDGARWSVVCDPLLLCGLRRGSSSQNL